MKRKVVILGTIIGVTTTLVVFWWKKRGQYIWVSKVKLSSTSLDTFNPTLQSGVQNKELQSRVNLALELRQKGNELYKKQLYNEAEVEYTNSIEAGVKTHNDTALSYSNRALCRFLLKKYQDAIEDCDKALEIDPRFIKAIERRAKSKEALNDKQGALYDYTAITIINSQKVEDKIVKKIEDLLKFVSEKSTEEFYKTKKPGFLTSILMDEFLNSFNKPIPFADSPNESPESLFNDALVELNNRQYEKCLNILQKLLDLDPKVSAMQYRLCNLYGTLLYLKYILGDAEKYLLMALEAKNSLNEENEIRIKLLYVYMEMDDHEKLVEQLRLLDGVEESLDGYALYHKTEISIKLGLLYVDQVSQIISLYDTSIDKNNEFLHAYISKFKVLMMNPSSYNAAEDCITQLLKLFPKDVNAISMYIEFLIIMKEFEKAQSILKKSLQVMDNHPQLLLAAALLELSLHQTPTENAINLIHQSIDKDPLYPHSHLQLAQVYSNVPSPTKEMVEQIVYHYEKAAEHLFSRCDVKSALYLRDCINTHFYVLYNYKGLEQRI